MNAWTDTQTELTHGPSAEGNKCFCRTKIQGVICQIKSNLTYKVPRD